uniref:Putative secreted protein n=1 Tax=Anopheles triannulatus TaxID=58253 RepID=A0A2M4B401_9DIPT
MCICVCVFVCVRMCWRVGEGEMMCCRFESSKAALPSVGRLELLRSVRPMYVSQVPYYCQHQRDHRGCV